MEEVKDKKLKEALSDFRESLIDELSQSVNDTDKFKLINEHLQMVNNLITICIARNRF